MRLKKIQQLPVSHTHTSSACPNKAKCEHKIRNATLVFAARADEDLLYTSLLLSPRLFSITLSTHIDRRNNPRK